jgi:hypothetical protein
MARSTPKKRKKARSAGKLRIADHWNAISIIASSQANPLKAVAEFVENSIDARARHIVITRGKKKGEFYLKVSDNGEGIPRDGKGLPDFRHVATHICDSVKRRLKAKGVEGIQGEFGIGLLSDPAYSNQVGLYRRGTRVLPSIVELDHFQKEPWTAGYLQGILDASFLNLTPGTRQGIIHDELFDAFCRAMEPVEKRLQQVVEEQRKAEEERSSRQILRKVQRALREAFLRLPQE